MTDFPLNYHNKNNYCLQADEINNVVVGDQLPGTQPLGPEV